MLSHLPATDALTLLHAELGAPPLVVLDPDASPRQLRSTVRHAAAHPDGGLIAVLVPDAAAAALPRTWLATGPAAVARADWAALVRHALEEKRARLGTGAFLCPGADEADELFAAPHVRAHPEAPALWRLADEILPLEGEAP